MAYYECLNDVCEKLAQYLRDVMRDKGLDAEALVLQQKELMSGVKDSYSSALLMTDTPRKDAPVFVNVPRPNFKWIVQENLEGIFGILRYHSTQQMVFHLAKDLRKKNFHEILTRDQKQALEEYYFITKEFKKVSDWMVEARAILAKMNENVYLLTSVTEEERQFARDLNFDWWYSYSDDRGVYQRGREAHDEKIIFVKETLAIKPHLKKVVEAVARANNFTEYFFTGRS